MISDEERRSLNDSMAKANKAKAAYDSFIKNFVEEEKTKILEFFCYSSGNEQELKILWMTFTAFNALESQINSIINTGKMAEIKLNSEQQEQ